MLVWEKSRQIVFNKEHVREFLCLQKQCKINVTYMVVKSHNVPLQVGVGASDYMYPSKT